MTPAQEPPKADAPQADAPHNFAAQKELHQRIRNDPDYDDWEYGTEPLPQEQEGWVATKTPVKTGKKQVIPADLEPNS